MRTRRSGKSGYGRPGWTGFDWIVALLAGIGLAFGVAGCGTSTGPDDQGRMTVLLTDAPFPFELVAEANVTISRVDVVTDAGVQVLAEGEQSFNLLELQDGVTAMLGSTTLPEGEISQIRLVVVEASVVLDDETRFDLMVPSGAQTGIKILTPNVAIEAGAETIATLDMDVSESFVVLGSAETAADIQGFIFTPVVRLAGVETADAGAETSGS